MNPLRRGVVVQVAPPAGAACSTVDMLKIGVVFNIAVVVRGGLPQNTSIDLNRLGMSRITYRVPPGNTSGHGEGITDGPVLTGATCCSKPCGLFVGETSVIVIAVLVDDVVHADEEVVPY